MKHTTILKSLMLAATLTGVAAMRAGEPTPVPASGTMGLLGQTYAGLTYSYVNLDSSPANADNYEFQINQALNAGLDGVLSYNFMQTDPVAGSRLNQQTISGALRAFSTSQPWGKPYIEGGVGYTRVKFAGARDNSATWEAAVGAELQIAPAVTVTPYIKYQDAPDLAGGSTWNFGAKANYWVNSQWSVTGGINRDDNQNTGYMIGTNFRF
jgi:hypothetical protein